jgi:DNA-directed RNA polymerase specialized sigma24 family protein
MPNPDRPDALTEALTLLDTFPPAQRARLLGALLDRRNSRALVSRRRQAIVDLVESGLTREQAAERIGCSPTSVGHAITERRAELAAPAVTEGPIISAGGLL